MPKAAKTKALADALIGRRSDPAIPFRGKAREAPDPGGKVILGDLGISTIEPEELQKNIGNKISFGLIAGG